MATIASPHRLERWKSVVGPITRAGFEPATFGSWERGRRSGRRASHLRFLSQYRHLRTRVPLASPREGPRLHGVLDTFRTQRTFGEIALRSRLTCLATTPKDWTTEGRPRREVRCPRFWSRNEGLPVQDGRNPAAVAEVAAQVRERVEDGLVPLLTAVHVEAAEMDRQMGDGRDVRRHGLAGLHVQATPRKSRSRVRRRCCPARPAGEPPRRSCPRCRPGGHRRCRAGA